MTIALNALACHDDDFLVVLGLVCYLLVSLDNYSYIAIHMFLLLPHDPYG